jgi:hypothetical protein
MNPVNSFQAMGFCRYFLLLKNTRYFEIKKNKKLKKSLQYQWTEKNASKSIKKNDTKLTRTQGSSTEVFRYSH